MKHVILISFLLVSALLCISSAWAQTRTVSGRVTGPERSPLPGVTVVEKGTANGVSTGADGTYTLTVQPNATLIFSYIGFANQEVAVAGRPPTIDIQLATDSRKLSEVVITALGVEREERALGYATSTIASDEVTRSRATNPMNALQGKVAGVNISGASGAPGASTKVILRGYSSVKGENNPLYVVDGVPIINTAGNFSDYFLDPTISVNRTQDFGNRANDINPDDIESITILKGASATSLYGSRAANGAILITTKKGRAGEGIKVELASSATLTRPLFLPQLQNTFGQGWNGAFDTQENGSWGPLFDGRERLWGNVVDNAQQLKPFVALENNLRDFYETGSSFLNSVAISGGGEKSTFYFSYGNAREDGVVPTDADSYNRHTLALRGSTQGTRLPVSTSLNFVRKDTRVVTTGQGGEGTTLFQEIIQIPRDISIVDLRDLSNPFNTNDNFYTLYAQNPYWPLTQNGNRYGENRLFGNVNFGYKLTDWLSANARIGGDVASGELSDWIAKYSQSPGSPNETVNPSPGWVNERSRFNHELNADFMLTTNHDLGESLHLNGLLGYNINERYGRNTLAYVTNLSIPGFYNLANTSDPVTVFTNETLRRLVGVYGQAELSYRDFLFLTLSARNDWSSTLPAANNSFFYPGINGSFVFTDVFPSLRNVLSYGKVRAAWGQTGNDAAPYLILSTLIPGTVALPFGDINFPIGGVNAYEVSNQIGNPALQPEITTEAEFGATLQFLNNRISADVAYYDRITEGQILPVPIAPSSGYTTQVLNLGRVQNRGIELLLTARPIVKNNFDWEVRYTFSNNRNKVLELRNGLDQVVLTSAYDTEFLAIPGMPLGVYKGPAYLRDPQGRIVVNPNTGFPLQAPEKEIYGTAQPDYLMGLYNTFSYKGVSLAFGFDARKGGLFYSYTQRLTQFVGNSTNTLYNFRQPFLVPNSVVQTGVDDKGNPAYAENTIPIDVNGVTNYWNDSNNGPIEREHTRDRSFLKLREVALGYNLPASLLRPIRASNVNISLVGRNLLLWTPENNNIVDPESTTFGNDLTGEFGEFAVGPTVRSLGLSLRIGF
jgi:TonB-linked SusC/RagA family outer membrane protein